MDGEIKFASADSETADSFMRESGTLERPRMGRPKTVRWFALVGLALLVVLGALYGFNWYRSKAIATFFANNKPPPAQIAAVTAETQSVPRFATAIGSLAAVHQVTITPEVGGKVTAIVFKSGATVKAGDPLVQLNDAPDRGDLANYEAQARMASLSLERNTRLANRQFASRETVDQNQTQFDQAKAQIAKTEAIIEQKLIRAPFAGRLGIRQVEVGQYVSPGAAIVTLTDLKELYVNFTLASTWRGQITLGQKVNVTADAFPGRVFTATITTIEPQIRSDTRSMTAQGTLANPDEALLPGMFVNVAVVLPPEPDKVVLPETAVDYTLYGDSVYVVREEGSDANGKPITKAYRTPVKVGPRWGGKAAILDGVKPGDKVVAAGQIKLQDGAQVIITGNPPPQPPANPTLH
jgi:multidrug efflux system membrane fusion protein